MAQFHRDIHGVRENLDPFAMANTARDLRRCCSCADGNSFPIVDEFGSDQPDPALFFLHELLLQMKGRDVPERFIEEIFHDHRAAVRSTQEAPTFQALQISPDGGRGDSNALRKSVDADLPRKAQFSQDSFGALLGNC
jgi:hypothetical protein